MSIISTVLCKTAGIAGMSAALYDAYSVGNANSKRYSNLNNADYFEKIHTAQRTLSSESPTNNAIQKKVANLRYNNPIVPAYGKIKGFIDGTLKSLGDNLIPIILPRSRALPISATEKVKTPTVPKREDFSRSLRKRKMLLSLLKYLPYTEGKNHNEKNCVVTACGGYAYYAFCLLK